MYKRQPLTRGIVSAISEPLYIETNPELQWVRGQGEHQLKAVLPTTEDSSEIYALLAICSDLHRLFYKGLAQGQATKLEMQEAMGFRELRIGFHACPKPLAGYAPQIKHYLKLFQPQPQREKFASTTSSVSLKR